MRYSEDEKTLYDNGKMYKFVIVKGLESCRKCSFKSLNCYEYRCVPHSREDKENGYFIEAQPTHQVLLDGKTYDVVAEVSKPSGYEGKFEGWEINIESVTLVIDKETEEEIVQQIKSQGNGLF